MKEKVNLDVSKISQNANIDMSNIDMNNIDMSDMASQVGGTMGDDAA